MLVEPQIQLTKSRAILIALAIQNKKSCVKILSFSDFNDHTYTLLFKFKLLKIADIFKIQKIIFMFDFINNDIPRQLKRYFYSSPPFALMKHTSLKFSIFQRQELRNQGLTRELTTKIWNQIYFDFIFNELNLKKMKL